MLSQMPAQSFPVHTGFVGIPFTILAYANALLLSKPYTYQRTDSLGYTALPDRKWVWHLNPEGFGLIQRSGHRGRNRLARPQALPLAAN